MCIRDRSTTLCRPIAKYLRMLCCFSQDTSSNTITEAVSTSSGDGTLRFHCTRDYPVRRRRRKAASSEFPTSGIWSCSLFVSANDDDGCRCHHVSCFPISRLSEDPVTLFICRCPSENKITHDSFSPQNLSLIHI